LKRAQDKKIIQIKIHNLRDFTKDKHKKVDDKPYGGGAGMVLMAEPIVNAVQSIKLKVKNKFASRRTKVIVFSAKGKQFNQKMAYDWSKKLNHLILISGRYEGIDERIKKMLQVSGFKFQELSIGPYVLTDGDVATMAVISAVSRLLPGTIKFESLQEESFFNLIVKKEKVAENNQLEYPHYTRPEILKWKNKEYPVPKVLLSGNHKKIEEWRNNRRKNL